MEKQHYMKRPKTVCIDFDGVIHDYRKGWRGIDVFDRVLPGASEATHRLRDAGYVIIIHTTRNDSPALQTFLDENQIAYDHINHNPFQPVGSDKGKIIADVYLDDRGICFTGDWNMAVNQIMNFKTWQQDSWE